LHIDRSAAAAIHTYLYEQHRFSMLPHDERILVERYEEDGYRHLLFVSLYGRRVNDVLSRAFAFIAAKTQGRDVQIGITDHGFVLTTIKPIALENTIRYLRAEKLRVLMEHAIAKSEVLSRRFRHCAARSLMILRSYKGERKSAGKQQVSSMRLLKTVREMSEDFPILREARREVLEDMMDIESATQIVEGIMSGRIRLFETNIAIPSPFAFDIALQGRSDLIKIEDRQAFLERMHNEVLAKIALNTARKRV
jgi:ATP-dependent helicase Lhr and Lhr-like helicase